MKKLRYALEYIAIKSLIPLIRILPRSALIHLAKIAGNIGYIFDKRGRTTSEQNLRSVFSENLDEKFIKKITKLSYYHFAQTFLDLFWAKNLNKKNYAKYVEMEFEDEEKNWQAVKQGTVFVTMHYSNFEWISYVWGLLGVSARITAQDFKNERLTKIFNQLRSGSGLEIIPSKFAFIKNLRTLKAGQPVAFLTDLSAKPDKSATVINCFGKKTCVTALHALLIKHTGAQIAQVICKPIYQKDKIKKYKIINLAPFSIEKSKSVNQIAQTCWDRFESYVKEDPAPWLWMYKHWRYLPKSAEKKSYPEYSNPNTAFEKICD